MISARSARLVAEENNSSQSDESVHLQLSSDDDSEEGEPGEREDVNAPLGSAWGYSNKDLKRAQLDDPNIGPIYRWLKHHRAPSQDELEASSPETKAYYIGFELLRFHNEVLYMFRVKDHGDKLLLPHKLREEAMQLHHNIPTAGHPGMNRTLDR